MQEEIDLNRLDDLVSEYLSFRGYTSALKHLGVDRITKTKSSDDKPNSDILSRIVSAFDRGDYPIVLSLWNAYVVQVSSAFSSEVQIDAKRAEFYVNVYCASYPFRNEVIREAGSPEVAAKLAARSMTIFKHFIETRGKESLKLPEFQIYKNLHKIGFPPTHPQFSHLFRGHWIDRTRKMVVSFLTRLLEPATSSELVNIFTKSLVNPSPTISEEELSKPINTITNKMNNNNNHPTHTHIKLKKKKIIKNSKDSLSPFDNIHPSNIHYMNTLNDLISMFMEVSHSLSESLIRGPNIQAAHIEVDIAIQSAMQASILIQELSKLLLRNKYTNGSMSAIEDSINGSIQNNLRESSSSNNSNNVASFMARYDLLQLEVSSGYSVPDNLLGGTQTGGGAPGGGGPMVTFITTITMVLKSTMQIIVPNESTKSQIYHNNREESNNHNNNNFQLSNHLITASLLLLHHVCKFITALSLQSIPEDDYLSAKGGPLIIALVSLLLLLPVPEYSNQNNNQNQLNNNNNNNTNNNDNNNNNSNINNLTIIMNKKSMWDMNENLYMTILSSIFSLGLLRPNYVITILLRRSGLDWILKSMTSICTTFTNHSNMNTSTINLSQNTSKLLLLLLSILRLTLQQEGSRRAIVSSPKLYPNAIKILFQQLIFIIKLDFNIKDNPNLQDTGNGNGNGNENHEHTGNESLIGRLAVEILRWAFQELDIIQLFVTETNKDIINILIKLFRQLDGDTKIINNSDSNINNDNKNNKDDNNSEHCELISGLQSPPIPSSVSIMNLLLKDFCRGMMDNMSEDIYLTQYKTEHPSETGRHFLLKYIQNT